MKLHQEAVTDVNKGWNAGIWSRTLGLLSHAYPLKELPYVRYLKQNWKGTSAFPFFITLPVCCVLLRMTHLICLLSQVLEFIITVMWVYTCTFV